MLALAGDLAGVVTAPTNIGRFGAAVNVIGSVVGTPLLGLGLAAIQRFATHGSRGLKHATDLAWCGVDPLDVAALNTWLARAGYDELERGAILGELSRRGGCQPDPLQFTHARVGRAPGSGNFFDRSGRPRTTAAWDRYVELRNVVHALVELAADDDGTARRGARALLTMAHDQRPAPTTARQIHDLRREVFGSRLGR